MQDEILKDIPGYEGIYQVSNIGNVFSTKFSKVIKLKTSIGSRGYLNATLCKNGLKKYFSVHKLVAMAFLNHVPCGYKLVIDHIDDNKLNNNVSNLQIVTPRENAYKTQGNYSSKYKGVSWHKSSERWSARIRINGKIIHIGSFKSEEEASEAYKQKLNQITKNK